ncbi:hypothetical protein HNV12_11450 [Methanococcoides sp. SA1]|nr:hypothetical protein [Methanococcoides sp. SA1]
MSKFQFYLIRYVQDVNIKMVQSDFCSQCGAALKIETAITMEEQRHEIAME